MNLEQDPRTTAARPADRKVLLLCLAWAFVRRASRLGRE